MHFLIKYIDNKDPIIYFSFVIPLLDTMQLVFHFGIDINY